MAKAKKGRSPGTKALLNDSKKAQSKGKKLVLEPGKGMKKEVKGEDLERFNTGMPPVKKSEKGKKKSSKRNVPHAY